MFCPPGSQVARFVRLFGRGAHPEVEGSPVLDALLVGIWLVPRDVWTACGGYDERHIYYNWMEVEMIRRLDERYRLVDLGEIVDYDFYHLEHRNPRLGLRRAEERTRTSIWTGHSHRSIPIPPPGASRSSHWTSLRDQWRAVPASGRTPWSEYVAFVGLTARMRGPRDHRQAVLAVSFRPSRPVPPLERSRGRGLGGALPRAGQALASGPHRSLEEVARPRPGDANRGSIVSQQVPPRPVLSFVLGARNDEYMGNSRWRLEDDLELLGASVRALGLERSAEVVVADWGSEVPLRGASRLTSDAAAITSFVLVPPPLALELQGDSPFPEVLAMNTAARRASGEYIGRIDQDTLVGRRFLETFLRLYQGTEDLPVPLESALLFSQRRDVPYGSQRRAPVALGRVATRSLFRTPVADRAGVAHPCRSTRPVSGSGSPTGTCGASAADTTSA